MLPAISFWRSGCTRPVTPYAFRYTAFVIKDADYLIKTWHPSCHAADFRQDIEAGFANTQWLGLTVFESSRQSR
jgi:uncharacterized protein YchJ